MEEKTTYGLSPERLARLLALGVEGKEAEEKVRAVRTPGEALQEMLSSKLPFDAAHPESIPAVLKRTCDELLPFSSQTLQDLLLDSETGLPAIKRLKDYGKELVRITKAEAQQTAATVIYYAAIASALVFHQSKITGHSYGKLEEAYGDLEQRRWIPSDLKRLFRRAKAACQQRRKD